MKDLKTAAGIARKFLLDEWVNNKYGMWTYQEKSTLHIRLAIPNDGYVSSMMYTDHLYPIVKHQEIKPNSTVGELLALIYPAMIERGQHWILTKDLQWEEFTPYKDEWNLIPVQPFLATSGRQYFMAYPIGFRKLPLQAKWKSMNFKPKQPLTTSLAEPIGDYEECLVCYMPTSELEDGLCDSCYQDEKWEGKR